MSGTSQTTITNANAGNHEERPGNYLQKISLMKNCIRCWKKTAGQTWVGIKPNHDDDDDYADIFLNPDIIQHMALFPVLRPGIK